MQFHMYIHLILKQPCQVKMLLRTLKLVSYDLTDRRNLRNQTEDHRGREGKMEQDETREEEKP